MSVFTTPRERRFWLLALVVLAAIYSTLGLAQTLAEALRERHLLQFSVGAAMVLVGVVAIAATGRLRPPD